jgi:hypothetical protein
MSSSSPPPPNQSALESSFDRLPDEMLLKVLAWVALLDPKTMMTVVHAVCRRWRQLCGDTHGVRLDFRNFYNTFLPWKARLRGDLVDAAAEGAMVASLTALAGRFKHVVECNLPSKSLLVRPPSNADRYVIALIKHCPKLESVNFGDFLKLTDASVIALAECCPRLTYVNFSSCNQLTDVGVIALAKHCPQLSSADFGGCNQLTDASVVALAKHCPQLSSADFEGCNQLTDASVVALAECCPLLENANFDKCHRLTMAVRGWDEPEEDEEEDEEDEDEDDEDGIVEPDKTKFIKARHFTCARRVIRETMLRHVRRSDVSMRVHVCSCMCVRACTCVCGRCAGACACMCVRARVCARLRACLCVHVGKCKRVSANACACTCLEFGVVCIRVFLASFGVSSS